MTPVEGEGLLVATTLVMDPYVTIGAHGKGEKGYSDHKIRLKKSF